MPVRLTPPVLISSHLPLVRKIAWQVHGRISRSIEIEDLIQIGMVALMEAAHHFEPRPGAAFATYATIRIRGAMIDELRRHANMTRGMLVRRKQIEHARREISSQSGRPATDAEVAERLSLTPHEIARQLEECQGVRYEMIDESYSDHSLSFADSAETQAESLERADLARTLAANLKQLPEREAMVLQLYFVEELNLEEIGEVLGVGAARVCQIKKAALERLRRMLTPLVA